VAIVTLVKTTFRVEYSSFETWISAPKGRRYRLIITNIHDRGKILHVDVTDGIAASDPSSNSFTFSTRYVESTLLMLKKCIMSA